MSYPCYLQFKKGKNAGTLNIFKNMSKTTKKSCQEMFISRAGV